MSVLDHLVKGLRAGLVVLAASPAAQQVLGGAVSWRDSAFIAALVTAVEAGASAYRQKQANKVQ